MVKLEDFDPVIYSRQCPKCAGSGEYRRWTGTTATRTSCPRCNGWGRLGIHDNAFPLTHPRYASRGMSLRSRLGVALIGLAVLGVLGLAVLYYLPELR